jgi:hypothetical protein
MFCFNCFQIKIKILCPICYEIGNVSLICGHIFCDKCLASITNCPLCRMIIKDKFLLLSTNCTQCNKQLINVDYACFLSFGHTYCFNCIIKIKNLKEYYFCKCKRYSLIYPLYFNKIEE